jgi:hypothetical protein
VLEDARPALNIPAVALARHQQLASLGFVPARGTEAAGDPRSAAGREDWWNYNFRAAEYGHADGEYPQMPDDNTPARGAGQSLSGHRRTHRVAYAGAEVTVRMPSVTAIKRFQRQSGHPTFDVPISAIYPDGSAQGWVRVTAGPDGRWAATPLGFHDAQAAGYIAESVVSVLEARRPTRALAEVGDLLARHRERLTGGDGIALTRPDSSWIDGLGYDPGAGVMVMTTRGREYGYRVPPSVYEAVINSPSPGAAYTRWVRNRAERVGIERCGNCNHFYDPAVQAHRCRIRPAPRSATGDNSRARAAVSRR